ncbi:MAG: hypothetical protein KGL48_09610 [Sphingomonadales bacterium]|nr:hypothetical protein [Sphingomonadales bacterium]MDE2570033.1 hypothetical protein [Sphingomonadales bacterium]
MRIILQAIGIAALLMGLLWVGQGTGLVMWPASSFMLAQGQWAIYGAILAALGVALFLLGRRR